MSGRRRRGGGHGGEFHVDERWMASYMDMVTVLMCLFIVLYAMSTVDSKKYDELKNALASGFGVTNSKKVDLTKGVPVPKNLLDKHGAGFTAGNTTAEFQLSKSTKSDLENALKKAGVQQDATVRVDGTNVTVGLVGDSAYFDGNSAVLLPSANTVLTAIAPIVAVGSEQVTVEGHADRFGDPAPYARDGSLAAARATAVLEYLNEHGGVSGTRLSSVSYGSARPVAGTADAPSVKNRRVDIVLHMASAGQAQLKAAAAAAESPAGTVAPTPRSTTGSTSATNAEGAARHASG